MAQAFKELRNIVKCKGVICVCLIVAVQGFESFFVLLGWKDGFGIFSMQPKYPKSGKARHVPVADKAKPIVLEHLEGKDPDDLVFTTRSGAKLNKGNVKRIRIGRNCPKGVGCTTCDTLRQRNGSDMALTC